MELTRVENGKIFVILLTFCSHFRAKPNGTILFYTSIPLSSDRG